MSAEKASDLMRSGDLLGGYEEAVRDGIALTVDAVRTFVDGMEASGVTTVRTHHVRELADRLDLELKGTA